MPMLTGLVPRRLPLDLQEFSMSSDRGELVFPLYNREAYSRWMVGRAAFVGEAWSFAEKAITTGKIEHVATVSIGEGRVIGIISPESKETPALWFSWPLNELTITTSGSSGVLKKRPDYVVLEGQTGSVSLFAISKLFRTSYQANKESDFMANLRAE